MSSVPYVLACRMKQGRAEGRRAYYPSPRHKQCIALSTEWLWAEALGTASFALWAPTSAPSSTDAGLGWTLTIVTGHGRGHPAFCMHTGRQWGRRRKSHKLSIAHAKEGESKGGEEADDIIHTWTM